MKDLIIVGAGGFGREVFAWASAHPDRGSAWRIAGFIDDRPDALDGFGHPGRVLGAIAGWAPAAGQCFVCAIGRPEVKRRVCRRLLDAGAEFLTLVHPSVILGDRIRLGTGVVLCPRVTLTADIELGDFTAVNCHSSVGHDVRVGAWTTVSGHCDLTGACRVGEGAFLGSGVTVLPGKSVGAGASVGAGSVVIRPVPAGGRVFGNPAREF